MTPPSTISAWVHPLGENLTQTIYNVGVGASGANLCDRRKSDEYRRRYERAFGERVRVLLARHQRMHGKDPEFIILTSCRVPNLNNVDQEASQRQAMRRFDRWLLAAERGEAGAMASTE